MRESGRAGAVALPLFVAGGVLLAWHGAVRWSGSDLFPTPLEVLRGMAELARPAPAVPTETPWYIAPFVYMEHSRLVRYTVASLFRVTVGFGLAVMLGIPFGLLLGWSVRLFRAFNPIIQVLRPISPIAWIPVAILWFGVDDKSPIFLIFLASVFPITVAAMAAVQNMQLVYVRAARNFGLSKRQLFTRVIFPACLPQILTGVRIALGVAWLVVVAAEMIAVNSGLGFLIIDARNAGKRYDLVVAGMVMIGLIGLVLDLLMRRLERFDEVRWGYASQ
ncbi:MAG: sulfonate ABC transporter permease [Phycisphaerae bacterium]|nr:MAG: ABC transporter permease [Planctomycetia bacterium]RIK71816.1 MAG: sulfonate ABC transporter permease [Planctomycetota bacterium]GJQ25470.1 MAG: sulfonate ABC transporter permease [Phycisphaerae bacterium]